MRIEFIGPPGAGKSTIYKEIFKNNRINKSGLYYSPDRFMEEYIISRQYNKNILKSILFKVLSKNLFLKNAIINSKITTYGWPSIEKNENYWKPLINHVIEKSSKRTENVSHYLKRLDRFIAEVSTIALFQDIIEKEIIFHDESLLQRGLSLGFGNQRGQEFVRGYAKLVPTPDVLVFVNLNKELLKSRLLNRNRKIHWHLEYIDESIEYSKIITDELSTRNVKIVMLDGSDCVLKNADKIIKSV